MTAQAAAMVLGLSSMLLSGAFEINASQENSHTSYSSSTYPWSVSYPANWTIVDKDPSFVTFILPSLDVRCGIHSARVRFKTVDELTNFLLAHTERALLENKGLHSEIVSQRRINLPNDVAGNEVVVNITPGGRSRRVFALVDGVAYVVDCETYLENWKKFDSVFDEVIEFFAVGESSRSSRR